jgi:hypothetical protein
VIKHVLELFICKTEIKIGFERWLSLSMTGNGVLSIFHTFRIFAWLALQFRLWTSERRYRHELDDSVSPCYTCLQDFNSASHIFVECVYARQVWLGCLVALGIEITTSMVHDILHEW